MNGLDKSLDFWKILSVGYAPLVGYDHGRAREHYLRRHYCDGDRVSRSILRRDCDYLYDCDGYQKNARD